MFNRLQRQIASDVLQAKIEFQATDKKHDFHKSKKYIGDSNATQLQYCRRRFSLEANLSEFTKFNQALLNICEACARILLTLPQFHIRIYWLYLLSQTYRVRFLTFSRGSRVSLPKNLRKVPEDFPTLTGQSYRHVT